MRSFGCSAVFLTLCDALSGNKCSSNCSQLMYNVFPLFSVASTKAFTPDAEGSS